MFAVVINGIQSNMDRRDVAYQAARDAVLLQEYTSAAVFTVNQRGTLSRKAIFEVERTTTGIVFSGTQR